MSFNRSYPFTESKLERWLAEGRGTGDGATYLPWLTEADLPPKFGHKDRIVCGISGRMGIAFSSVESDTRHYYEAVDGTVDVREQFPLNRDSTRAIARSLGIQHPKDDRSQTDIVMTTDLVVTRRLSNGLIETLPRSCKMDSKLHDFNQAEHAEIERRYWELQGFAWKFVTNSPHCLPPAPKKNLAILRPWRFAPHTEPFDGYFDALCSRLVAAVLAYKGSATVEEFGVDYQTKNGLAVGEAIQTLLHLIFRHRLRADLFGPSILDQRVEAIAIATSAKASLPLRNVA